MIEFVNQVGLTCERRRGFVNFSASKTKSLSYHRAAQRWGEIIRDHAALEYREFLRGRISLKDASQSGQ